MLFLYFTCDFWIHFLDSEKEPPKGKTGFPYSFMPRNCGARLELDQWGWMWKQYSLLGFYLSHSNIIGIGTKYSFSG